MDITMKRYSFSIFLFLIFFLPSTFAQHLKSSFSPESMHPRMRVIIDNDFAGDPDGLFQLAQEVLSPSVEIRAIIGSHLKPGDPFDSSSETATHAAQKAKDLLAVMGFKDTFNVIAGSNVPLAALDKPQVSEAAKAIVAEAMRTDVKTPLYVVCGAGLTDIASAYLLEPKIADKITLVWIGGSEYPGQIVPPNHTEMEYNLGIDPKAGQVIFNQSTIPVWQVPRATYRQALFSYAELITKIKPLGATGAYLTKELERIYKMTVSLKYYIGETYILGDSPLVLLTALQSSFESDPSSSYYELLKTPRINDKGLYESNPTGRLIRVYTKIDSRLMFDDLVAKLSLLSK